ncbi:glycosyltransferase [Petrotoga sp. Shatin.DS.tank11.9.2.9.3]|uniref:glycosyltransferase n=1 Tax=Petrotoga sp. Shatin.DS.tank11.9.2.9.3 TaxID=1469556 RepID=UPI000EF25FAC|nr:glycosyltransferase [Petrotoga sp. Shatin.DS.tank11.9.2.9.3]RLL83187.1 glycosyltransferase [Petrotoga sp. Shatin.DS.tank11.9.2.9.3]
MSVDKEKLLSVAMIVKDEEANIRRALEAIKDVADEIIVVDTGSTDRTPQIVKEYTDKLYFHEWQNDFSEARNYSLKFPTCEWVLIYDADEEASESFKKNIRDFLMRQPKDVNTVYIPTISYMDIDYTRTEVASTPRIFRKGTIEYKNVVHNQAKYKPKVVRGNFPILHYGYIWTRALKRKKYERTGTLIREQLKDAKHPIERLYYLVQLYKTESIGGYTYKKNQVAWETFAEIRRVGKVPAIGLEFLYMFGLDCMFAGLKDLGRDLLQKCIDATPQYPDPYFGMMALYERSKDWDELIKWGEKFFKVLDEAMKNVENFDWTIMSFKQVPLAHILMARAMLKRKDFKGFNNHISIAFSEDENINIDKKNLYVLMNDIKDDVEAKDEFEKLLPGLRVMIEGVQRSEIVIYYDSLVEKIAELEVEVDEDLLDKLSCRNELSKYIIKKMKTSEDQLLDFITKSDYLNFIEKSRIPGLLLFYSVLQNTKDTVDTLKTLSSLRKIEDEKIQGVLYALLGDCYLSLKRFKEALSQYKKSLEILPELSQFIKPIIEDLSTKLDPEMDGVYEEMYSHFTSGKEFIFDILGYVGQENAEKLYLISDAPLALYVSGVSFIQKDPQKAETLLKKIENIEEFPFYYYRLAKIYEKKDNKKAFEYHIKAVEENNKLADLALGIYSYSGLYPNTQISFMKNNDEIIWAGNISEKFSTLGIIHPIRSWKKSESFMYASPYPSDEALRIYEEREKETYKSAPLEVKKEVILKGLIDSDFKDVKVLGVDKEKFESVFEDLGVSVKDTSNNLLIVGEFEKNYDLSDTIKKAQKVLTFVYVPDLKDRENLVWFIPKFRVLRTTSQLISLFEKAGFKVSKVEAIDGNLRCIQAYKE